MENVQIKALILKIESCFNKGEDHIIIFSCQIDEKADQSIYLAIKISIIKSQLKNFYDKKIFFNY